MWMLKITGIWKISVGLKDVFIKNERTPFIKNLILAAIFEPVLYMLFETLGVSMTTNVTAAVICSLAPISSCIIEEVFLKERSSLLQKIFLGCGIFGVIYISVNTSTTDGKNTLAGILFLLAAVVAGSFFCAFSRRSSLSFSSSEITYFSCMLGAVAFNLASIARHILAGDVLHYFDPYFEPANIIGFLFLSIVSTIIAVLMNNFALSRLQVSTMAGFGGVSTIVTIIIGMIFANETLEVYHFIGLPFILLRMIGVSAISIIKSKKVQADQK
jgi:drug/metabolite transporter (DMT)-like permease